jgi:hypothetical protein
VNRRIPFAPLFVVCLALVSFLPLYVERTMTHVMFADGSGGAIWWGWKRCTLREYSADYCYMRPEQQPALWLVLDVALALGYASVTAFVASRFISRGEGASST